MPQDDVILTILQKESENHSGIITEKAYPITTTIYQVNDMEEYILSVSLGSVTTRKSSRTREGRTFVEITQTGSPISGNANSFFRLPTTNDEQTLHRLFQQEMQEAYRRSIRYHHAITNGFLLQNNEKIPFDPGYEALPTHLSFDEQVLTDKLRMSTGVFEQVPGIVKCQAQVQYVVNRLWMVQDRDFSVHNDIKTTLSLWICRTTDEGTLVSLYQSYTFDNPDDIFQTEEIQARLWELYNSNDSNVCTYQHPITTEDSLILKDWWLEDTPAAHEQTSLLDVMQKMVREGKDSLYIGDKPTPYNISYLVTDAHVATTSAILGFSATEEEYDTRKLSTSVEIGNDERNSDHFVSSIEPDLHYYQEFLEIGNDFPLDNQPNNIKRQLWRTAAGYYPSSVRRFQMKELSLSSIPAMASKFSPDRSYAFTKSVVEPRVIHQECLPRLQNFACEFSQLLGQTRPHSWVEINAYQANAYYADADGLSYVQPVSFVKLLIVDEEENYNKIFCFNEIDELETHHDSLVKVLEEIRNMLDARSQAVELQEIYDGPVLIVGDAAADFFAQAFLKGEESLLAERKFLRLSPGTALHLPPSPPLSYLIDQRIVHPNISIYAHDQFDSYKGKKLIGSYMVDAEGIPVQQTLELIRNGRLMTLLSNRESIQGANYSNGHQRLAIGQYDDELTPKCGPGVIMMNCHNILPYAKLLKRLRESARSAGYDHAYLITDIITNDEIILYRINAHNGKTTLVRNAKLKDVSYRNFQEMSCAGSEQRVHNLLLRSIGMNLTPCSVILPEALLFDRLELTPVQ